MLHEKELQVVHKLLVGVKELLELFASEENEETYYVRKAKEEVKEKAKEEVKEEAKEEVKEDNKAQLSIAKELFKSLKEHYGRDLLIKEARKAGIFSELKEAGIAELKIYIKELRKLEASMEEAKQEKDFDEVSTVELATQLQQAQKEKVESAEKPLTKEQLIANLLRKMKDSSLKITIINEATALGITSFNAATAEQLSALLEKLNGA